MKDKVFKFDGKKITLKYAPKADKAFDYYCNAIKKDAYSMPSKFFSQTLYYPATKDETQTYYSAIQADLYVGKELLDTLKMSDEFDSAKEAAAWIYKVFQEMFLDILEQA